MQNTADLNVTQCYRTIDQLENLKIRIILRKVADRRVPLSHMNQGSALSLQLTHERNANSVNSNLFSSNLLPGPEELVVKWQKKVMSPQEMADKSNIAATSSTGGRKKGGILKSSKLKEGEGDENVGGGGAASQGGMFLFTYIDSDEYTNQEDVERNVTTSKHETLSEMAKRALTLTKPLTGPVATSAYEAEFDSRHTGVSEKPVHLYKPLRNIKFEEMHVMAYIYSEIKYSNEKGDAFSIKGYEKRLCTIKCYDSGLVTMTPGLSESSSLYQFQINEDVFQYRLELISKELDAVDEEKEWKIYSEFYDRRVQAQQAHLPTTFQKPPSAPGLRVVLMGEIASAYGFNGESIYIHYLVDLTEGWTVEGGQLPLLSAYTQCSSGIYQSESGLWEARFAFPMEVELISGQGHRHSVWPKIYFEVCSMDSWDRSIVVGYGYADLPKSPGCYDLKITTWKPLVSPSSQLKSSLVGGSAELDDLTYNYIPFGHKGPKLIKYGFQTETSGTINFKMNLIHQQGQMSTHVEPDELQETDPNRYVKNNAKTISEALQRAKSRLETLRASKKNE
ncbi:Pleiotropic negative transcriptional regulator [Podochytrium sp. JEL0797]|nr:Pleiotropic negative transcriptional regulator [Podochytrium sp. JEL0797]